MEKSQTLLDQYAVVGYPVEHSRSPTIHQLFAKQTGESLSYELLPAEPDDFETAVRGFAAAGGKGLNVTVPYKEAAFELANELGPEAERARAVNTLSLRSPTRIRGDNTDGIGFLRDLTHNNNLSLAGKRVLVLGAGGAARDRTTAEFRRRLFAQPDSSTGRECRRRQGPPADAAEMPRHCRTGELNNHPFTSAMGGVELARRTHCRAPGARNYSARESARPR